MSTELEKKSLHEVIDLVDMMCTMQVNGIDSAIPFLRGEPGGGKTESIRNMAAKNKDKFLSCHFALKQPEDLGGIPQFTSININGEEILSTKWSIPEILEQLIRLSEEAQKEHKKVIFFLDDIHRCGPFHVTALFELLSERKIREIHLPKNVAIVLAGNGSIKAGAQLTNSAIINRCAVLDVRTDFDYWKEHWALPNGFNLHLLSFLTNQKYRHWFHSEEDIDNPWASPRSWSKLSNILNQFLNEKETSADLIEYICQAHVGEAAAKDFVSYYQIMSNFNVNKIFREIEKDFSEKSIQEVVQKAIKIIQGFDELKQFALSHAILIEFTQSERKEREKRNLYDVISTFLVAFYMNPKSTFPEITISILKELLVHIIQDPAEKDTIKNSYSRIAREVGCEEVSELIRNVAGKKKGKSK